MSLDFATIERFIGKAHLAPPIPPSRMTLIDNGISREEYARRFGMDEASSAVFMQRESVKTIVREMGAQPKEPVKERQSVRSQILKLVQANPAGMTSLEISNILQIDRATITARLHDLKVHGHVVGTKIEGRGGRLGYAMNWVAVEKQKPVKLDFKSSNGPSVKDIQKAVAHHYLVTMDQLLGQSRVNYIVKARTMAVYLTRELKNMSTVDIGVRFANRDHSTIMHCLKRAPIMMQRDPNFAARYQLLKDQLGGAE